MTFPRHLPGGGRRSEDALRCIIEYELFDLNTRIYFIFKWPYIVAQARCFQRTAFMPVALEELDKDSVLPLVSPPSDGGEFIEWGLTGLHHAKVNHETL